MQNHVLPYLQSGRKRCEGETRTAGGREKMRAEKLCQELALKQIQQLRMKEKLKKGSNTEKGNARKKKRNRRFMKIIVTSGFL